MKRLLALALVASLCLPAQAEFFRPSAVRAQKSEARHQHKNPQPVHHEQRERPQLRRGSGYVYNNHYRQAHVYRAPLYRPSYPYRHTGAAYYNPWYTPTVLVSANAGSRGNYRPAYGTYGRPNNASRGLLLGGIAGAIIGHNNSRSHNGWRGAAIGAGAGWLLGTILDSASYRNYSDDNTYAYQADNAYLASDSSVQESAPQQPATQNVQIINNYYNAPKTSMSEANSLFGR